VEDREKRSPAAGEDTEGTPAEDVELHRRKSGQNPMANDEQGGEGGSDDDVELHRRGGTVNPL
jgi:hypothetical protein